MPVQVTTARMRLLCNQGPPEFSATLYSTSGGVPSTALTPFVAGTLSGACGTGNIQNVAITFPSAVNLQPDTTYALVCRTAGTTYLQWLVASTNLDAGVTTGWASTAYGQSQNSGRQWLGRVGW